MLCVVYGSLLGSRGWKVVFFICTPRELRVDQTRTVYSFLAPRDPLPRFLQVALTNESTVSGDFPVDVCGLTSVVCGVWRRVASRGWKRVILCAPRELRDGEARTERESAASETVKRRRPSE